MRLHYLSLENIGPFDRARLQLLDADDEPHPVAFITGENGTGKSIVLDAIRGLFGPEYATLERSIVRKGVPFDIDARVTIGGRPFDAMRVGKPRYDFPQIQLKLRRSPALQWVVDFWRPGITSGSFEIKSLTKLDPEAILSQRALQGTLRNAEVTELICFFDYLRDSSAPAEKRMGERLYETMARIIRASVLDGELDHVERSSLTPIIKQSGQLVPIANLSAGNAYLIQRLVGLLAKMYAVHVLHGTDPDDLCGTPGLLLIDEAESHLHPRWQKRFVHDILGVFPNLQIIATTHSPFILTSWPEARVFVCRYDREAEACVIEQQHERFADKPVDEVLLSDAFDGTQPFGPEITELLERRARALAGGDDEARRGIEHELRRRNPQYFGFLDVEERLRALGGGG